MEDGASLPSQVEAICVKSQEASGEEVDEPAVSRGATPSESKMSPIEERIEVPDGRREERRGAFLDPPSRTTVGEPTRRARLLPGPARERPHTPARSRSPRERDGR